jgi:hypothetical protein
MKTFKVQIENDKIPVGKNGKITMEIVEVEAMTSQDAKYACQKKYDLHHSQVTVFSSKFQKLSLEELKKTFAPENRGGVRENSGAKPKYSEPTKTISFRCPESKIDELKKIVKEKLNMWSSEGMA